MKLTIADDLKLPLDVVTEKLAWLGRTGSGKTYGAMKLAELMLAAGAQIGVLDPVGVWRGLRVPAEQDGTSFEVVVFGGLYGDLPLEPTAGELIADLVCDRGISFVLDVSQFIPSEQQRFVRAFADRFFHRKKSSPSAVHLFMEECQEFIPENPSGDEAKTLGVMQRLWKLGRNFGIGGSLISQRPQEIAKKALNMSGTMFAFQMTGPQERKAVKAWVADHGVAVDIESILQKLAVGQPHVESPTFLQISKTIHILPRVTADLSSTPKVGASTAAKRPLTPIDVEKLKASMAATIEKAKADDPKELRKRIAELQQTLKSKQQKLDAMLATDPTVTKVERVEVPVLKNGHLDRTEKVLERVEKFGERMKEGYHSMAGELAQLKTLIAPAFAPKVGPVSSPLQQSRPAPQKTPAAQANSGGLNLSPKREPVQIGDFRVSGPQQTILNSLAWLESIDQNQPTRSAVAFVAEVSSASSGFDKNLSTLNTHQLISYPAPKRLTLTDAGRAIAEAPAQTPTVEELQRSVLGRLSRPQAAILTACLQAYPAAVKRTNLAAQAGQSDTSSGFDKNVSTLRTIGLVDYPEKGSVRALPVLFLEKE